MNSLSSPTPPQSNSGNNGYTPNFSNEESNRKLAHNIASRFRRDDRFTGKLGENITEAINNYIDAAVDYQLMKHTSLSFFTTCSMVKQSVSTARRF